MKLLLVGVVALALAGPALASEQHPTQSELETELVCPACKEPLDESSSPIAQQMKRYIREHIAIGWTKSRIESGLEAQLGPSIYGVPRKHGFDLLAWLLPIAGILLGAIALAVAAWVWSRKRPDEPDAPTGPPLDPALERRVDEALAGFDG